MTPPCASISRASAPENAPEPPFGTHQLQRWRPWTSAIGQPSRHRPFRRHHGLERHPQQERAAVIVLEIVADDLPSPTWPRGAAKTNAGHAAQSALAVGMLGQPLVDRLAPADRRVGDGIEDRLDPSYAAIRLLWPARQRRCRNDPTTHPRSLVSWPGEPLRRRGLSRPSRFILHSLAT
jgi:hypothetical protein